jgi:hypothetical protein
LFLGLCLLLPLPCAKITRPEAPLGITRSPSRVTSGTSILTNLLTACISPLALRITLPAFRMLTRATKFGEIFCILTIFTAVLVASGNHTAAGRVCTLFAFLIVSHNNLLLRTKIFLVCETSTVLLRSASTHSSSNFSLLYRRPAYR